MHVIGTNKGRWWNTIEVSGMICMAIQCFVGGNVRFLKDTNGFYVDGKEYPYLWELWRGLKILWIDPGWLRYFVNGCLNFCSSLYNFMGEKLIMMKECFVYWRNERWVDCQKKTNRFKRKKSKGANSLKSG
jgi:hypothetical protein